MSQIKAGIKLILCLDIDDKTPEIKLAEVVGFLKASGISVNSSDPNTGVIAVEGGEVLFVPFGLWGDRELQNLSIARHSFEDYLIKIALGDPALKPSHLSHPIRECLQQIVSGYAGKGCAALSSAQIYQLLKPFLGLPKHETRAISELLERAKPEIVREVTIPIVTKLNSFLAGMGGQA